MKALKVGDRVAWSGTLGSYAEYVAAPEEHLVPVPAAISDEQATAAMMHGLTAHYLVTDAHKLKAGETALVHAAAGGVGLMVVQMAHAIGARVIGTASSDEKAQLAREAGADEVIVFTRQDFETEVKRLTGGKGVEVVYDGVGKATFEKNLNVMRLRGMLVVYGMSSGAVPPVDPAKLSEKGSLYMARTTLAHFTATREELLARTSALFGMIADGKLKVRIAKKYPLAEAAASPPRYGSKEAGGEATAGPVKSPCGDSRLRLSGRAKLGGAGGNTAEEVHFELPQTSQLPDPAAPPSCHSERRFAVRNLLSLAPRTLPADSRFRPAVGTN